MNAIHVEGLTQTYRVASRDSGLSASIRHFFRRQHRTICAVREASFAIANGEVVGFLGANGAGKTTTLKVLTGLIAPSEGEVRVAGYVPFERQRAFLETISLMMGQKQQLVWDLPAMDSFMVNAAVYRVPTSEARRRISELAEMLSLGDEMRRPVRKLSLGERMKCELIAALLHRPRVLLLDEPTLGLDMNAQDAVRQFLRDYNQRYRATILLTSHYINDIVALCSRVLVMHEGALVYQGPLDELVLRYAPFRRVSVELSSLALTERVAEFGEVQAVTGRRVVLAVPPGDVTRVVEGLLRELKPLDLTVSDPPIEQVVRHLLRAGLSGELAGVS
jgi:ABC-2 type transport system ATP-binding protein